MHTIFQAYVHARNEEIELLKEVINVKYVHGAGVLSQCVNPLLEMPAFPIREPV